MPTFKNRKRITYDSRRRFIAWSMLDCWLLNVELLNVKCGADTLAVHMQLRSYCIFTYVGEVVIVLTLDTLLTLHQLLPQAVNRTEWIARMYPCSGAETEYCVERVAAACVHCISRNLTRDFMLATWRKHSRTRRQNQVQFYVRLRNTWLKGD